MKEEAADVISYVQKKWREIGIYLFRNSYIVTVLGGVSSWVLTITVEADGALILMAGFLTKPMKFTKQFIKTFNSLIFGFKGGVIFHQTI